MMDQTTVYMTDTKRYVNMRYFLYAEWLGPAVFRVYFATPETEAGNEKVLSPFYLEFDGAEAPKMEQFVQTSMVYTML